MFRNTIRKIQRATVRTVVKGTVFVGVLELTTNLPSQGRSSWFYHHLSNEYVTPSMRRLFDPETAHNIAIFFAKKGFAPIHKPSANEQRLVDTSSIVFGKKFPNPIGLAAGFDKDAEVIRPMLQLGFGFVEVGTVTPVPQPGNPKPRMFRLLEDRAIINRYGFNSAGATLVEKNLQDYRFPPPEELTTAQQYWRTLWKLLYGDNQARGLVGVNIGKNKSTVDAKADYVSNIQKLGKYADYLVVNVSSPNTSGLRDLQQAEKLEELLAACLEARNKLKPRVPLLVKLAPDLTDQDLEEIASVVQKLKVDGMVVTNTTNARPADLISHNRGETGGLSGAPVKDVSTRVISKLYALTNGKVPIIGVGGVENGHDVYEKLKAGASLVQIYSMMVYRGPGIVSEIRDELALIMRENGHKTIDDVIGLDHQELFWQKQQFKMREKRRTSRIIAV